jgi:hypothetical protein
MNEVMNSTIGFWYSTMCVKGTESAKVLNTSGTALNQKSSWSRTGVPRKNQM